MQVHYSSKTNEWTTPQSLFDVYNAEFGFTLDAAASPENAKCERYFTERDNGLAQSWHGETVWLNPPYGRAIGDWIKKAWLEAQHGATVVCLIPSRTDTSYWHKWIFNQPNVEVRFLKGRIKFGDAKDAAPFPSALVVFNGRSNK